MTKELFRGLLIMIGFIVFMLVVQWLVNATEPTPKQGMEYGDQSYGGGYFDY